MRDHLPGDSSASTSADGVTEEEAEEQLQLTQAADDGTQLRSGRQAQAKKTSEGREGERQGLLGGGGTDAEISSE